MLSFSWTEVANINDLNVFKYVMLWLEIIVTKMSDVLQL